jgi:RNA recognition motif-containing protein
MNMYVGNLNYRVKEGDLEQAMAAYGVVTSVKVIKDREQVNLKDLHLLKWKMTQKQPRP